MMRSKYIQYLSLIILIYISFVFNGSAQAARKYTLGIVPQYRPSEIFAKWVPLLNKISHDSGIEMELKLSNSFKVFESELEKGTFDFVYMNPYQAMKNPSYFGLLRA